MMGPWPDPRKNCVSQTLTWPVPQQACLSIAGMRPVFDVGQNVQISGPA